MGLIFILPNLVWQYNNNFPVFYHLKELTQTQLVNVNRFDFLKNQLLFFIGSLIVIFSSFYALLFYKPFQKYRLFFFSILFTLIAFLYFHAKDYYAIGIYPIYIAFGSVFLADVLKDGWKKYLQPIAIAVPLLYLFQFIMLHFQIKALNTLFNIQKTTKIRFASLGRWQRPFTTTRFCRYAWVERISLKS
jgi:hypothetical protein